MTDTSKYQFCCSELSKALRLEIETIRFSILEFMTYSHE